VSFTVRLMLSATTPPDCAPDYAYSFLRSFAALLFAGARRRYSFACDPIGAFDAMRFRPGIRRQLGWRAGALRQCRLFLMSAALARE
jgi:hypothetical protein